METSEERNGQKEEMETLKKGLSSLNEEELTQVAGGELSADQARLRDMLLVYLDDVLALGYQLQDSASIDVDLVSHLKVIILKLPCNQTTANYFFDTVSKCGAFVTTNRGLVQLADAYFAST